MEFLITTIGLVLVGLLYFLVSESRKPGAQARTAAATPPPKTQTDPLRQSQRRAALCEEKLKKAEEETEALRQELAKAAEREKGLLKERSEIVFDSEQYEKFKKDFGALKEELARKEETLETEISQRRAQAAELTTVKQERDALKKRVADAEDSLRGSQASLEAITQELDATRKTLRNYQKIAQEHKEQKIEGEWVARAEFEKVERELKEKEIMLQRLLALKKGPGDA